MKKKLVRIAKSCLLTYVLVEIACAVFIYSGYIQADKPSFSYPDFSEMKYPPTVDTALPWGTWHIPNIETRYFRQAFDVHYSTNNFGMRDQPREEKGDTDRIVWIGDSFMEGYGVEAQDRASNLLEKMCGREVLNFGCSGNFGTTQERLLYEGLASKFTHNTIIWGLLPANDFHEDNPANAGTRYAHRYRPYLEGNYPEYKLAYHESDVSKSDHNIKNYTRYITSFKAKAVMFLKSFTYWMNVYEFVKTSFSAEKSDYSLDHIKQENLDRMVYNIARVARMDSSSKIMLLVIPTIYELKEQLKGRKNELPALLKERLKGYKVEIIDLSEETLKQRKENLGESFIDRDGHWTKEGNKFYADIIRKSLSR